MRMLECKRLLKAHGYGLQDIADQCGLTPAMISYILNEKKDPNPETKKKILALATACEEADEIQKSILIKRTFTKVPMDRMMKTNTQVVTKHMKLRRK